MALKVSPRKVYNVLGRGRSAVSANDSRTRLLTMRVSHFDRTGPAHGRAVRKRVIEVRPAELGNELLEVLSP